MTMTMLDEGRTGARRGWHQRRADLAVAVAAAGAAAATWWVLTQVVSVPLVVGEPAQEVGLVSVVVTALVATLAGAGLLRVLARRIRHGRAAWTGVAATVLVVSMLGPLAAATTEAGAALALLHLVVGVVAIGGLRTQGAGRLA